MLVVKIDNIWSVDDVTICFTVCVFHAESCVCPVSDCKSYCSGNAY